MKVLHVTQPVEAGTANVVKTLVRSDLDSGHEVTIGCPASPLTAWAQQQGALTLDLPMSRSLSFGDLRAAKALRRSMASVDVVVLHSSKAGAIGRATARTRRKASRPKVIFYPHGWSWLVPGRASSLYRTIERILAPSADAIVAVSSYEATLGSQVLSSRGAGRLITIRNGVDLEAFTPVGPAIEVGTTPTVVCVGRLCEQKGQDLLIGALTDERLGEVNVILVGEGPARASLEQQADVLGVSTRVEFVGFTDPRPFYRSEAVVVMPSRWEGFSLVTLEAMACGANLLASVPAAADFVDGQGIRVMPELSTVAIVTNLVKVFENRSEDPVWRVLARKQIEDSYSWEKILPQYEALIAGLFQERS